MNPPPTLYYSFFESNQGAAINPERGGRSIWQEKTPLDLNIPVLEFLNDLNNPRMPPSVKDNFATTILVLHTDLYFTPICMKHGYQSFTLHKLTLQTL
ncbi:hypothetical protein BT96DRAFT_687198 [Gymnopus androsaceus JB14]|uniref:Uncharacterized protein n=1 Tax=Gymnopus androsaceus JB14 TaxID=1447944 RepID=A0A6A4HRE8_9AGAR|nr:hypothetical protein BT96DRAFT_687198 [Gymnopus androsaceus JB14]